VRNIGDTLVLIKNVGGLGKKGDPVEIVYGDKIDKYTPYKVMPVTGYTYKWVSVDEFKETELDAINLFLLENLIGKETKKYKTIDWDVCMNANGVEVGCQIISIEDAIQLAKDILNFYQV
jgi:hypothetical protein